MTTTRQRLLEAAAQVITQQGVANLTLDAVAQAANVSKGGLLYHFPSKEALVQGILQYLLDSFGARLQAELARSTEPPAAPGRWLRAYIRASFAEPGSAAGDDVVSAALAVAVASDPALLQALRSAFGQFRDQALHDGLDPVQADLIRLATDGLWFSEVLQLAPLPPAARSGVIDYLLQWTYAGASATVPPVQTGERGSSQP